MTVLATERLLLRKLSPETPEDVALILRLLNEPSFLRNIGDKKVRTLEDARQYILKGPVDSYERNGFGMYLVVRKEDGLPLGMCGLVKRPNLPDPDIGFAFLPEHWGQGYAVEAASAVLAYGRDTLKLPRLLGIVSPGNQPSIKVLTKIGLAFEGMIRMPGEGSDIELYGVRFA